MNWISTIASTAAAALAFVMAWLAWHHAQRAAFHADVVERAGAELTRARLEITTQGDWLAKLDAQQKRLTGRLYAEKRGKHDPMNGADDDVDDGLAALLNYQKAPPARPQ